MNFYSTNSMKNFNDNNCNEDKYATINNTMDDEFNRFINAAKVGDLKEITHYVRKYPQYVNLADSQCGFTALMHAAEGGHYNLIRPLVDNGADTNLKDSRAGRTALMLASSNGHTRCIETLITHGKAQIQLQDSQKHTAAYYATHHGHGNNKIIARLLQIQNSNNNNYQHFGNHNSNHANNNSRYHQASSTNTSFNFSLDSPSSNNVTNSIIQDIQNQSFTEKGLSYFNSNTSSIDQYNQQNQRRFSIDNTNALHNQRLQDFLINNNNSHSKQKQFMNRNHAKMRSNTISNTLSSRQQSDMNEMLKSRGQGNHAFNVGNQTFNGGNQSQLNSSNLNQFASLIYQHQQQPDYRNVSKNLTFELQKLSIPDYNNNGNPISPISGNFPENGILNGNQKNYFQNDSMFESPQTNNDLSLNQYCTDRVKNDLTIYSFNESNCNDSFRGNRPRNSTFSNGNGISDNSSQTSDETKDERFDGFAESLDCFLRQYCLERFRNIFSEKKIDLFAFLSLKENDLKNLGIVDEKDLADILSNQITYRNLIGMGKDLSNYCIYLMKRLESTKKELNKSKKEKFYLNLKKDD